MSNEELIELLKYCSPYIIYIVKSDNDIIKVQTPFDLLVKEDIGTLKKNQIVSCIKLNITRDGRIVFLIDGKNYHTNYFDFLI